MSDVEMQDAHDSEIDDEEEDEIPELKKRVYVPGISRTLKEGEEWDFDASAYRIFHTFETELPCLSFDVVADPLGDSRDTYPMECFFVGGTQAEKVKDNQLIIMRLSNMHGMDKEEDDEESSSDEENEDEETKAEKKAKLPTLHTAVVPHYGDVNRVKFNDLGHAKVCAVWNDLGKVQIWNLMNGLQRLEALTGPSSNMTLTGEKPMFSHNHTAPGFALGWSPLKLGMLASGDQHRKIFVWNMGESGQWQVDQRALTGHESSVEDLQWSCTEEPLLVSCSADRSIRLWDVRAPAASACVHTVQNAHETDVNVLSWNRFEPLIVSGGDDGLLKIWSLKTIQYNQSVATFRHHKAPITTVEWNNNESTTLMAAGEDHQITMWDFAMEADDQQQVAQSPVIAPGDETKIPPQLLFVHMGCNEVKEVHWHPQITNLAISTALDGFHVFRTINI